MGSAGPVVPLAELFPCRHGVVRRPRAKSMLFGRTSSIVDGVVGGLQSMPSMSKVVSPVTPLRRRVSGVNEMLQSCARRKSHPIMIFNLTSGDTRMLSVYYCTTPSTAPVMSSVELLATVTLIIGKGNGLVPVQYLVISLRSMNECLPPRVP